MANEIRVTVRVPNLRNGLASDIEHAAPRASIPSGYKLAMIAGLQAGRWVPFVNQVIRAQYAQMLATVQTPVPPNEATRARNAAIVTGAIRAAAADAYQLTLADLNASEIVGTGSRVHAAIPAVAAVEAVAAVPADPGHPAGVGVDARPATPATPAIPGVPGQAARPERVDADGGTAGGNWAVAVAMAPLTAVEVAVVDSLLFLGFAVPALQGTSLTISGHHYLPTTRNVYAGTLKQVRAAGGADVSGWIDARGEDFFDWAFHKACHPINAPLKRRLAKDSETGARLTNAGLGAAAIRIPALPSDAQAGKAGIAVIRKAAPVIRAMGHTVSFAAGEALVRAAEQAQEGPAERLAIADITSWVAAHGTEIAFCAGIVSDTTDAANVRDESTLKAFSVKKAIGAYPSSVAGGLAYSRSHRERTRAAADAGTFPDPAIQA